MKVKRSHSDYLRGDHVLNTHLILKKQTNLFWQEGTISQCMGD